MWNSPLPLKSLSSSGSARTLSCWQLESLVIQPQGTGMAQQEPQSSYSSEAPWEVKAFQGAGLVAWGSEYRTQGHPDVANFDYWKELLQSQQLVKEVSSGETGTASARIRTHTNWALLPLFRLQGDENQGKGVDCITCSGSLRLPNTEPNSGGKCLLRPQGQIYICLKDLENTLLDLTSGSKPSLPSLSQRLVLQGPSCTCPGSHQLGLSKICVCVSLSCVQGRSYVGICTLSNCDPVHCG